MSKMKVVTPFWDTRRWDRYRRQFEELASMVELHIISTTGPIPESEAITFYKTEAHGRSRYRRLFQEATMALQVKPDLIYSLSALSLQASALNMSLRTGAPYILRVRGDGRKERRPRYSWLNRIRHNIVDRETLARASRIIPISSRLGDRMKAWDLEKRTRIEEPVPNGIDLDLFKFYRPNSEFTVGYAGHLTPHKNIQFMIKLMEVLPRVRFLVAGWIDSDYPYKLPYNCEELGPIPFEEMPTRFYDRISLFINPSFTEGFPKTLLEAYGTGRPIMINQKAISSDIPIIGKALPLNLESWARAILHYRELHETGGLDSLGQIARETAMRYSWDRFREDMVAHFKEVADQHYSGNPQADYWRAER